MDIEHVRIVLKDQLKAKGIKYEDIAEATGVSVPTVKRWLTKSEIPFSVVDRILQLLGTNWMDFTKTVESSTVTRSQFSKKQEDLLSQNPRLAYLFLLLYQGLQVTQIKKLLHVDDRYLEKSYIKMEKAGLLQYFSLTRVKVLTRGPFRYRSGGPFAKRYLPIAAKQIFYYLNDSYWKHSVVPNFKPGNDIFKFGEIFLSERSFERMKLEVDELIERYQEISRRESLTSNDPKFQPRVYMLGAANLNLWRRIMWDQVK